MNPKVRRKLTTFLLVLIILGGVLVYAETIAPNLLDFPNAILNIMSIDTGQGAGELYGMDQDIKTSDAVTFATVDTGQGANELYDMDQNLQTTDEPTFQGATVDWFQIGAENRTDWPSGGGDPYDQSLNTTDAVTFATVDTGQGAKEVYAMDQDVTTGDDVTFGTVDTGQGANELYDMDQNVQTTDEPTFQGATVDWLQIGAENRTDWPSGGEGGSVEELARTYVVFTNASGIYMVDSGDGTIAGSSVDADDVLNAVDGNMTELGEVYVKAGTYDLDGFTKDNDWKIVAEEGTIFNLTATPSMTLNGKTVIENVNFTTTFDGVTHIIIKNHFKLKDCILDFKINCTAELEGVIDNQDPEGNNIVEFIDTDLYAGKDTAQYFLLYQSGTTDTRALIFRNFNIRRLLFNTTKFYWTGTKWVGEGRVGIASVSSGYVFDYVNIENVNYDPTDVRNVGSFFLDVHGHAGTVLIDGYYCENGIWNETEKDSFMAPVQMFDYADYVNIDDMILRTQFHPVIQAKHLVMNNFIGIGTGDAVAAVDLGSTDPLNATATITNWFSSHVSLAMNTGWGSLHVSNSDFNCSRIYIIDEGSPKGQKKYVTLTNVDHTLYPFWPTQHLNYSIFIQISYGQQVNLPLLKMVGVNSYQMDDAGLVFIYAGDSASQFPTVFHLDDVSVTGIRSYSQPRFLGGATRTSDDQVIRIYNSDIITWKPPLENWNPIRVNDQFDNVVWWDTNDNDFNYSESVFNATISSGSSSVTVSHDMPTRTIWSNVQITPTGPLANCSYYWWTWEDFTEDQITIYVGADGAAKNCNSDISFIVGMELKP